MACCAPVVTTIWAGSLARPHALTWVAIWVPFHATDALIYGRWSRLIGLDGGLHYAGIGAEGQYRAIQARFGYDEGHRVSSAAQRVSPTTVRVLAGDADFVRQTLALGLGNATPGDAARIGVPLALLTFAVLLPLDYLWWRLLGMI